MGDFNFSCPCIKLNGECHGFTQGSSLCCVVVMEIKNGKSIHNFQCFDLLKDCSAGENYNNRLSVEILIVHSNTYLSHNYTTVNQIMTEHIYA